MTRQENAPPGSPEKLHCGDSTLLGLDGPVTVASQAQTDTANKYLADNWAKAIG